MARAPRLNPVDYDALDNDDTITRKEGETRGRKPDTWKPVAQDYRMVKQLASIGAPKYVIAIKCGVTPSRFEIALKRDAKLQETFMKGRAAAELVLVQRVWERADNTGPGALEAQKFLLTHQFGWASKQIIEDAVKSGIAKATHKIVKADPAEREEFERQRGIASGE